MRNKPTFALALFAVSLVSLAGGYAQDATSHFSLSALGQYLDYKETASGSTLDKDYGMMWGASAQWRQDIGRDYLLLAGVSFSTTSSATYAGALQYSDGTTVPYSFDSEHETIWLLQADLGYKLYKSGGFTVSPLLGLGYRDWSRGQDDLSSGDYQEDYHWFFLSGGADIDFRTGNWRFGFLGKLAYPISPVMQTDVAGTYPSMSFALGSVLSCLVTAAVQYRFPSSDPSKGFFLTLSPFYEHWGIGESDVNQYGLMEPDSSTNIYGVTIGFGMDASLF